MGDSLSIVRTLYLLRTSLGWANPEICPLPGLGEHIHNVIEVCLAGRGIDDGLDRNTKERQSQEENKAPEDEFEKGYDGHQL